MRSLLQLLFSGSNESLRKKHVAIGTSPCAAFHMTGQGCVKESVVKNFRPQSATEVPQATADCFSVRIAPGRMWSNELGSWLCWQLCSGSCGMAVERVDT